MFTRIADGFTTATGSPKAFIGALAVVLVWAASGPFLHYSDTWQLTINTGTTIVTFLMVFLIQASQNRIGRATQLKLDELILKIQEPDNAFAGIEKLSDADLDELEKRINARRARGVGSPTLQP